MTFARSVKIGKMSQTPSHILENLQTALPAVANTIKGGWDNIQNFAIKTNSSVSLPIWSCTLDETEGGRWSGLQAEDAGDEESDSEEEVKVTKKQASEKGRKRTSNSDEEAEEIEKPRKKTKAAADSTSTTNASKPPSDIVSSKKKSTEIVASPPKVISTSKKGKLTKAPVATEDVVSPGPEPRLKTLAVPESTEDTKGKKAKSIKSTKVIPPPSSSKKTVPFPAQDKVKINKQLKDADTPIPKFSKEMKPKKQNIFSKKFKSKGGKSMKNAVLGKRVGQE